MANEAFSLKSASVRWAGWATVTYGRVGKLKARVGKGKYFSALRAEFCPPWLETLPAPLSHSGPSAWNRLPEDIRAEPDITNFRKLLKTHYFNSAFNVK